MKEKYVSIETIYNEWFGIETYTRIITGIIYSLDTLHPEWRNKYNSESKKKLSHLQFIATTVATLYSSTGNPDALVLGDLEDIIPKTKRSLFGINKFIKQIQKGGKLNGIVLDEITQKDMVTGEIGVPNDVIRV